MSAGSRMKVWQRIGSHLDGRARRAGRGLVVGGRHRRAAPSTTALARLAPPVPGCADGDCLAVVTLVAYTLVALLPPYLAKLAVDDGIVDEDLRDAEHRRRRVPRRRASRRSRSPRAQTYFTGWVGERALADLRIQLFRHLQRLSLGYYERNRTGAIVSRITNDVEALDQLVTDGVVEPRPEHARPRRHRRRPLPPRLAARARDSRRASR